MGYYGKVKPVTLAYYRKPLDVNQKVYGTPGAGLDSAGLDAGRVAAGQKGEKRVGDELERLAAQYPNTYVFHSVKLYGSQADIDHVVVQGKQVLLVDAKNWSRNAEYEINTVYNAEEDFYPRNINTPAKPYKEYFVSKNGADFPGGKLHLPFYMEKWDSNLKKNLAYPKMEPVKSVLVIANDAKATWGSGFDRSFWFSNLPQLEYVFRDVFSEDPVRPLSMEVLRFFADRVQASVPAEVAETAAEETYFAYQVNRQPASGSNKLMFWAAILGAVGCLFHWWAFVILASLAALITGAVSVFVLNPKREPSYRKRTGVTKLFAPVVIFFLLFAITSVFKGVG